MKQTENQTVGRGRSILWKHMIMMLSVLLLAVTALVVIHRMSLRTLTEENLTSMERSLARSCSQMETDMFMTLSLPAAIENTEYYRYLRSDRSGVLHKKYAPVLYLLHQALNTQTLLRGSADITVLYLPGTNSVVSSKLTEADALTCFTSRIVFPETGAQLMLGYLRQRDCQTVLPMQPCSIDGSKSQQYLALILHPIDQNVAVMSLYTEQTLLNYLGMENLPEGTWVQLTAGDGRMLMQYSENPGRLPPEDACRLDFSLGKLGITATFCIPQTYFRSLLQPVRRVSTCMILFVLLTGAALSFILSRESVKPIRQLISSHGGEAAQQTQDNEIRSLDRLLSGASQRTSELNDRLTRQSLAHVLSGAAMTQTDEEQLMGSGLLPKCYRAAILHAEPDDLEQLERTLPETLPGSVTVRLSRNEISVILPAEQLEQTRQALSGWDKRLSCGISAPVREIPDLLTAAHQARAAMPQHGTQVFFGESTASGPLSWMQHERLYQSIFSGNQTEAEYLLSVIAQRANYANIRALFYNVCFILRSAAEEMGVELPEEEQEYRQALTPQENIRALEGLLQTLIDAIREQQKQRSGERYTRILDYIVQNASDSELCAAKVGEDFGVTERRIYDVVRQNAGVSFSEYLLTVRMKQAGMLLCNTQLEVSKISRQCGYQSNTTFYRAFNRFYGMKPSEFRRAGGAEPVPAAENSEAELQEE